MPYDGWIVGCLMVISQSAVNSTPYVEAILTLQKFNATSDFDANFDGKNSILMVLESRSATNASPVDVAFNSTEVLYMPLQKRVEAGQGVYFQGNAPTSAIVGRAIVYIEAL